MGNSTLLLKFENSKNQFTKQTNLANKGY